MEQMANTLWLMESEVPKRVQILIRWATWAYISLTNPPSRWQALYLSVQADSVQYNAHERNSDQISDQAQQN